jgi:NAD(P)-dependent dehydrogenase (short-subunit alcohol dehydrogenase family)
MTDKKKVWFITGAARGIGLEIAKAALGAGDRIVATGRKRDAVEAALPTKGDVLALDLDVTDATRAFSVVEEAVEAFGRIDVLVNNAGYGLLGVFEGISHAAITKQFETNVYGTMHVTRAVLPMMRAQKGGRIFNLSSVGGAMGFDIASIYCATKFAVEGFSECLALEVKPFDIKVTIVEPGFFRTDFLDPSSIRWADKPTEGYADYVRGMADAYAAQNHARAGDPAKLGAALVRLSRVAEPPMRFLAGSDAVRYVGDRYQARLAELNAWKELSRATDIETAAASG